MSSANLSAPSAQEIKSINDKILDEFRFLQRSERLQIDGTSDACEDWFCDVRKFNFSLAKMRSIAEKQSFEASVDIDTPSETFKKQKLAKNCQEYVDSLFPILTQISAKVK